MKKIRRTNPAVNNEKKSVAQVRAVVALFFYLQNNDKNTRMNMFCSNF